MVLGGESSGTKITTKILEANGAKVVRRSMPYAQEYPDLDKLYNSLKSKVFVVITIRSWYHMLQSQVRNKHTDTIEKAEQRTREGYKRIFSFIQRNALLFTVFSYDALIANPKFTQEWLLKYLDFNKEKLLKITNENKKYAKEIQSI